MSHVTNVDSAKRSGYTLGVVSGKGGVGKSTLSGNTAAAAASAGARVLLIDADQQRSLTSMALTREATNGTILDAIREPANACDFITAADWSHLPEISTSGGVVDLLPGHTGYADSTYATSDLLFGLRDAVENVRRNYDLIVIDCPPSKGPVVQSALLASDGISIVTTPEFLDVRGLAETLSFVNVFRSEAAAAGQRAAEVLFLVVNRVDIQQVDHRAGLEEISSQVTGIPWKQTPRRAVVPRAAGQGMPLVAFEDRAAAPVAEGVRSLTADILHTTKHPHLEVVGDRLREQIGRRHTTLTMGRSA